MIFAIHCSALLHMVVYLYSNVLLFDWDVTLGHHVHHLVSKLLDIFFLNVTVGFI